MGSEGQSEHEYVVGIQPDGTHRVKVGVGRRAGRECTQAISAWYLLYSPIPESSLGAGLESSLFSGIDAGTGTGIFSLSTLVFVATAALGPLVFRILFAAAPFAAVGVLVPARLAAVDDPFHSGRVTVTFTD